MERPWLKWERDLGASRREITVPAGTKAKSGTVMADVENGTVGILLDDVDAGEAKTVAIIAEDAAVDVAALIFDPTPTEEERAEVVAELARSRILDRK